MVRAVDEQHAHALHRRAGELAVLHRLLDALVDRRPEALRDHAADDLVDELVADAPPRSARARCGSRRTGRGRRSASCTCPARATRLRIVSRYGTRGWCSSTSTPKRRFSRSTATSTCIWREPGEELLAGLRVAAQRRASGPPRPGGGAPWPIFSSSPFAFGVIAKLITGSGKSIGGSSTSRSASSSTSPVFDVLQLRDGADVARAERVRLSVLLALHRAAACRCAPSRACARSTSVESDVSVPASTRKTLIRPANGSATVLKTNAAVPRPRRRSASPFFAGDGTPSTSRSSSAVVPRFFVATPRRPGRSRRA